MFNAQGDVVALVDGTGKVVVEYSYDAWGQPLTITGSMMDTLGKANPLRYRCYVYDEETGLYYLGSRYYNPVMGRFINADSYISMGHDILGGNLFTYCANNPVNHLDPTGHFVSELLEWFESIGESVVNTIAGWAPAYGVCGGAAIADGPLPMGDVLGFLGAIGVTFGAIGYGIYQASTKSDSKAKDKSSAIIVKKKSAPTVIYRYGGTNPGNLTPKKKDASTGLSFSTIPRPGAAVTTMEALNATGIVYAVKDGATHVSVRPVSGSMQDWINAGSGSIWTQAVKAVVIKWDGVN